MPETIAAVEQGSCTECDKSGENWRQAERDFCSNGIDRLLLCECRQSRAVVRLSPDGLTAKGRISHEDASWNEGDSDE
jgi:hypothetical protein